MVKIKKDYDEKLNSELTEEELKQKISDLCKESLEKKWYENSQYKLGDPCPFCDDAIRIKHLMIDKQEIINYINECEICLCPNGICWQGKDKNEFGIIQRLIQKYPYDDIKNIEKEELIEIQNEFKKHIIN